MTRIQKLRSMNTYEVAKWLNETFSVDCALDCPYYNKCDMGKSCESNLVDWLEEEYTYLNSVNEQAINTMLQKAKE